MENLDFTRKQDTLSDMKLEPRIHSNDWFIWGTTSTGFSEIENEPPIKLTVAIWITTENTEFI